MFIYNDRIVEPVELMSINEQTVTDGFGHLLGKTYRIRLQGTLLPNRGSPNSQGQFWTDASQPAPYESGVAPTHYAWSLQSKKMALSKLLSLPYRTAYIGTPDGSGWFFEPRLVSLNFTEGHWVDQIPWIADLETARLRPSGQTEDTSLQYDAAWNIQGVTDYLPSGLVSSYSETWQVSKDPVTDTWSLQRNCTAVGIGGSAGSFSGTPIEAARVFLDSLAPPITGGVDWIPINSNWLRQLAYVEPFFSGIIGHPVQVTFGNYRRNMSVDVVRGQVSLQESWTARSGFIPPAIETWNAEYQMGRRQSELRASLRATFTGLEGTVVSGYMTGSGFFLMPPTSGTAIERARQLYRARCHPFGMITWNQPDQAWINLASLTNFSGWSYVPASESVSESISEGVVTVTRNYDVQLRPITSGAIYEYVEVNDQLPTKTMAAIPIPGREYPIIQDLGHKQLGKRTARIYVCMASSGWLDEINLAHASGWTWADLFGDHRWTG